MKAYIDSKRVFGASPVKNPWVAEVVSAQDYHERGPHSISHRTKPAVNQEEAEKEAAAWAAKNGYEIVSVEQI